MELVPRITRAQAMDALSSMASIAGYEAVLIAAGALPKMFPMMMTAAGTITPAKVLVLGAGVAGLAGNRDGAAAGRGGFGVRRSRGGEGADREPGREVRRARYRKRGEDKGGYAKAMDEAYYRRQRELLTEVIRSRSA